MPAAQIVKWGNSLAVRIPKPIAKEAGVREGDPIVIEAAAAGEISLRRKRNIPTLKELTKRPPGRSVEKRTSSGNAEGGTLLAPSRGYRVARL
jgi:antitoxin component of MazEF toxin-antitoxin module